MLSLSLPEDTTTEETYNFIYSNNPSEVFDELNLSDYASNSVDNLEKDYITCTNTGRKFPITSILEGDINLNDEIYSIFSRRWLRIPKSSIKLVNTFIDQIEVSDYTLPSHYIGEREDDFCERVGASEGLFVTDSVP